MQAYRSKVIKFFFFLFLISSGFGGLTTGFLFPAPSFAAVFNVTTSAELQTALTTAQSNGEADTINIDAGTYSTGGTTFTYTGASTENFALTIIGAGAETTLLDGGSSTRVLNIDTTGVSSNGPDADITITDLTIQNGKSTVDGFGSGGLQVRNGSADITIEDCRFSNNSNTPPPGAIALGGGARFETIGDITLTNNTFDNNSATASASATSFPTAQGGGAHVRASGANITLTNNTFVNNSATSSSGSNGGGAFVQAFAVTLTNNTFDNNSVASSGGGAFVNAVGATLTNNTFVDNSAFFGGGAFVNVGGATLTNNTFTLNFAGGDGGGLRASGFDDSSTINIYNNIIRSNTATGSGDDIFVDDNQNLNNTGSPVNLFNNDFSDFFSVCENTPIPSPTPTPSPSPSSEPTPTPSPTPAPGCTPNINQGNNIDADPLFVDAPNGDVHIQSGSPAIDAGDPSAPSLPATDFEGDTRDSNPDIGADEFVGSTPTPTPTPTATPTPGVCGDGTLDSGEECDDGNTTDGDCCSSTCEYEPVDAACGDLGNACVNQDTCDGAGACTDNGFKPSGMACGNPADTNCNNPDTCNGTGSCQANLEPNGTSCSDGNNCTQTDSCQTGVCTGSNPVICNGLTATMCGTPGNNNLTGTAGADVIAGLGGHDTINSGNGNDRVCGGDGNDTMSGGNGNDTILGDAGKDTLNGNGGNDTLNGGTWNDILNGGIGNDSMNGGAGTDKCDGGAHTSGGSDSATGCETVTNVP